jgi:rhodanese-related sulfurtransferase
MSAQTVVQTVQPSELRQLQSQGTPIDLIDVRTPAEFASVHAQGAKLVPLDQLNPSAVMASRAASPDQPLYVICRSGARAAKACEAFASAGFSNVISVEGGTDAWERAGLPVVRGKRTVMSLERQVRVGAGVLVLLGAVLGWLVHPALHGLSAFVGAGLLFAGITDWCGMGLLLARMPWNQRGGGEACSK